ncbi:MAG TPA: polysaccharide deacetylase family protein [Acidimicrobiales bacterium]|nr:polysaccharide deacetylase family protein [Acidimicrobiales bacterium]
MGHTGPHLSRRQVFAGIAAAVAAAVLWDRQLGGGQQVASRSSPPPAPPGSAPDSTTLPPHPVAVNQPGPPEAIFAGDPATNALAFTIDDGTCPNCAAEIVSALHDSGFHATLGPNGYLGPAVWDAHADAIAAMAATGQVAICNHTWDHQDLTTLNAKKIKDELVRNEAWIQDRFGVSSRPFYRPPYGFHDLRVDDIAGELGWTKVMLWSATLGDSIVHPPDFLLQQLQGALTPGTILLGHANHPPTASLMGQIIDIVQKSGLRPVTLLELLGTDPNPDLARPDLANHRLGPPASHSSTTAAKRSSAPTSSPRR